MEINPIKNKRDYQRALKGIEGLMHAKRNTLEGDRLDVLVALVEAWEAKHYPLICPIQSKRLNTTWSRKD
jgi:HTH-type transcriptional regulator/antitoxin HigA